ncbi:NHS-like protein 3 isoform X2 [Syngnathus scovelli]|nr:uncharacterized protein KIAA1522 homolog isoform X2 [Syngnathus scovelli]
MSNRDSLGFGELIPHDVVEIFAQEKHHKKGRKKRSRSLGRALGWLKGKKRKDLDSNGQNPGLGPALDLALDGHVASHHSGNKGRHKSGRQTPIQGNSHAVLNLHDEKTPPPPLLQENVFIEASRPKYLEDLHTEALEGLKMMQQEDNNAGVDFRDNESTTSTMTAQTDGEGGGFTTDSTIPDASSVASMRSSASTRSSRSGLTRQGSTFRPLNSGKPSEKGRTRRRHRKTVGSIPRHVQQQLGLDRVGRAMSFKLNQDEHFNNKSDSEHPEGSESDQNVISEDQDEQICSAHLDDLALLRRLGPDLLDGQRPRSLAVASMTTANSQEEMPSPVMSISPQAAYMSKIIPNAVLPPSIEVVEISRGQSRNSLRTVSKSSLYLPSPSPSRTSRISKISSTCRHNPYNLSDASGWSHSESSETLVSDSSTISSGNISRKETSQDRDATIITVNGKLINKERGAKQEGPFARSLSVMKSKRAPPPPSRSYSLHNKMKRRSRDLAEVVVISKESSHQSGSALSGGTDEPKTSPVRAVESPGYNGDTSSLEDSTGSVIFRMGKSPMAGDSAKVDKTVSSSQEKWEPPQENKVSKITSPSSGYSSQDCTSPQLQPYSSSPKNKRGILAKLQRLFPGASSSSPLTHLETTENTKSSKESKSQIEETDCESVSPSVRTLRELFDIPPHPKVHAPPAPPPEVWAHSKRTFELLLGPPAPDNVYAIIKKNPKDRRRSSATVSAEGSVKSSNGERKLKNPIATVESTKGTEVGTQKVQESALLNVNEVHKISNERLIQNVDLEGNGKVEASDEKVRVSDVLNGMLVKAVEKREERLAMRSGVGNHTKVDIKHGISLTRTSPSPSPPPAHFPPEPPGKQNPTSPESSWPPPPPPIIQVLSVPDEVDFPPPPPPLVSAVGFLPTRSVPAPTIIVTTELEPQNSVAPGPPLNIPPPPAYAAPPPPIPAASPLRMTEVITSTHQEVSSIIQKVSPPPPEVVPSESVSRPVQVLPSLITKHVPPPLVTVKEDPPAHVPPEPAPCSEETVRVSSQEKNSQGEETRSSKLYPPESIPPPPPSQSLKSGSEVILQQESISSESQSQLISCQGILTPPQSIPPPPTIELLPSTAIEVPNTEAAISNLPERPEEPRPSPPAPPPLPVEGLVTLLHQTNTASTENKSPELSSDNVREEPIPVVTPSLLQMVKLRSVNSSPQPPEAQEQAQAEDVLLLHQTNTASAENKSPELSSGNVHEESIPVVTPSLLQMVKLRSVNSSPQPPEAQEQAQAEDVLLLHQTNTASAENKSPELSSGNVHEESISVVTPSLLQMVKLRSVNISPQPPAAQEQAQDVKTIQQPNNLVPSTQANNEAPQKPIRRSLILSSPTSTSSPADITSVPALPEPVVVAPPPPAPSPAALKSPATITSPPPSMNLQEVIRMRTAARSKDSPALRLSLQSPTSPKDPCQSPTSTASFIFSKNKRVGLDTKAPLPKAQNISTKMVKEVELTKNVKMPPPVAKKPKTKSTDVENGDGMEQTAGQPAQSDSIGDAAEKSNGAEADIAEEGGT